MSVSLLGSMLPEGADAALIHSAQNRRYFTSFVSSEGYLLVTKEEAFLLVDSRYWEAARMQAVHCQVIPARNPMGELECLVRQKGIKTLMLEGSGFTLNEAGRVEEALQNTQIQLIRTPELDRLISKQRILKTEGEIECMMRAQQITEEALKGTLPLIKEGVSEEELALELEYRMRRKGAQGVSFDLIVISGEKTSMPHGVPGQRTIRSGDFITFDIGALVDGYHSDMTRTYAFGSVTEKQKRVYQTVYQAQQRGLEAVRSGVTAASVDKAARSYIDQAGYAGMFGHSTGHGVGLDIHEEPSVSSQNQTILESGMVITVEPGIYLPGEFGVRIEDMVVVTRDGCLNLATLPKELIIL